MMGNSTTGCLEQLVIKSAMNTIIAFFIVFPYYRFNSFFLLEKNTVKLIFNQRIIHSSLMLINKAPLKEKLFIIYMECGNVDGFAKGV